MGKQKYHFLYIDKETDKVLFYRINEIDKSQEEISKKMLEYNKSSTSINIVIQVKKDVNPRLVDFMDYVEKSKEEEITDPSNLNEIKKGLDNVISECEEMRYEVASYMRSIKGDHNGNK